MLADPKRVLLACYAVLGVASTFCACKACLPLLIG